MLYRLEDHAAIEINLVYIPDENRYKTVMDALMRPFTASIRELPGWDVVSFAMLGRQDKLIRYITWYGFKPIGQAILRFTLDDPITLQVFQQQQFDDLPDSYAIRTWQPSDAAPVAQAIYESFSTASDSLWDPRFRSLFGAQDIVRLLTTNYMGLFMPDCTSILTRDNQVVGFCFFLMVSDTGGNVPLIGVLPGEKNKRMGNRLLKHTLDLAVQKALQKKLPLKDISATMETDNVAALKMYRRLGFREEYDYPHAYLDVTRCRERAGVVWC
jgi:ribosomal protein S18 acetylase RimI-like enzyme